MNKIKELLIIILLTLIIGLVAMLDIEMYYALKSELKQKPVEVNINVKEQQ